MNFYAFHIGDYASATQHLTDLEDLAYRRMMDVYYVSERALPLDRRQLYRLVRANTDAMRQAVDVVVSEFFTSEDDGWHHKRCDAEIAKAKAKSEKAKANGKLGGLAKANRSPDEDVANANQAPSKPLAPNPNPNPIKDKDDDAAARARRRQVFDETEAALRSIPELTQHPIATNTVIAPIFGLVLDKGYDLHTQVIPSIRRQLANARKPIKGWGYFVDGIVQDAAQPIPTAGVIANGSYRKPSRAETFAAIDRRIEQLAEAERRAAQGGPGGIVEIDEGPSGNKH